MSTERISSRRVAFHDLPPPIEEPKVDRKTAALLDRIESSYDASILAAAAAARTTPPPNTDILYFGLNPESEEKERSALAKTGTVHAVATSANVAGESYDFTSATDVYRFVDSLHVDPRVTANVADAILQAPQGGRTMLAQLAVSLSEGERGGAIPSRFVMSAHSGGSDLFGFGRGFGIRDLQRLFAAMPRAAAQIQDLHLSACSTSGQAGLEDERAAWQTALPSLKTIWAYAGTSKLAPTGELEAWGRATNHPHDTIDLPSTSKQSHVAVWSQKTGYRDNIALPDLRKAQAEADHRLGSFLNGTRDAKAFREEALLDYETYRMLSQRSDVPAAERAVFAERANKLLRIRYYGEGVSAAFAKRYGESAHRAFAALAMPPPDFSKLPRNEALAQVAEFEKRLASTTPVPPEAAALMPILRGLRELDKDLIPESDCQHR